MGRNFGVMNAFQPPYKVWTTRKNSIEEAIALAMETGCSPSEMLTVKDKLAKVISKPFDAASHILMKKVDNYLEHHVDKALEESVDFRIMRELMPAEVPEALDDYQRRYTLETLEAADEAIKSYGIKLADGQYLFHGGHWISKRDVIYTTRPFSTSFCPQIALRNAEWIGKAYAANRVDLMIVRVTNPQTNAYVYSTEGEKGHEKEVVFASGARLERLRETEICEIEVCTPQGLGLRPLKKNVMAYVVDVDIS